MKNANEPKSESSKMQCRQIVADPAVEKYEHNSHCKRTLNALFWLCLILRVITLFHSVSLFYMKFYLCVTFIRIHFVVERQRFGWQKTYNIIRNKRCASQLFHFSSFITESTALQRCRTREFRSIWTKIWKFDNEPSISCFSFRCFHNLWHQVCLIAFSFDFY